MYRVESRSRLFPKWTVSLSGFRTKRQAQYAKRQQEKMAQARNSSVEYRVVSK